MTLRDWFAVHAPSDVLECITGSDIASVRVFLSLPDSEPYHYTKHWVTAETRARYIYADAMLKAREL